MEKDFTKVVQDVVVNKQSFIDYLLFMQSCYRTQRGMWPDEWDALLHYTYWIDDIINNIIKLENEYNENVSMAKEQYFEKLQKEAEEKARKEWEQSKQNLIY